MTEELDFMEEIRGDAPVPRDEQLATVAFLAQKQKDLEASRDSVENYLKKVKEELRQVSEDELPKAMHDLGLSEFKLTDGSKVTIKPYYGLSIPQGREEEAYKWLNDNGHGDIVKHSLTVTTRLTSDQLLEKVRSLAAGMQLDMTDKIGIHHMTGSAWVREQEKNRTVVPLDILTPFTGFRAKVEEAK